MRLIAHQKPCQARCAPSAKPAQACVVSPHYKQTRPALASATKNPFEDATLSAADAH